MFEDGVITVTRFGGGASGVALAKVTSVSIVNDQLVVNGTDLNGVTGVRITGPSSFDETFSIESKSAGNLIANGLGNVAFAMNGLFNLILTDAQGAATFQVTFTLQDGAVTASKLHDMGAGVGQVLKYDGTNWGPSDLGALTYAGTWDASTGTAPNVAPSPGEYYIVDTGDTGVDISDGSGVRNFAVGDWLVYNDVTSMWDKIDNATNVTSFEGRSGPVTAQAGDYTWAQINKTSSVLSQIADVEAPAGDGSDTNKVLKWNNATSMWELADDLSGGGAGSVTSTEISDGAIVDADVNGAAAIAQSKIANLTTDLAAKVSLAGGTMTGDLTVPNLVTSGNVDGVDVSALNTTVGTNATNIGNNATAIGALDTDDISEGTALYFTDARARTAAVVNSTAGTETDQAASVAAMKTYVTTQVGSSGDILDGGNTEGATVTIGTNDANSLAFETNNSTAMTILSGGNVGIGTASPDTKLDINGHIISHDDYRREMTIPDGWAIGDYYDIVQAAPISSGSASRWKVMLSVFRGNRTDASFYEITGSHSASASWHEASTVSETTYVGSPKCFTIDYNGNNTSPQFRLRAVRASASCGNATDLAVSVKISSEGWNSGWTPLATSGSGGTVAGFQSMGNSWSLYTGLPRMLTPAKLALHADSNGNVGIGTASPNRLLEVAGPIRVSATALPGSPATGDMAIDSGDSNKLKWYDGSSWQGAGAPSGTITSINVTAPVASSGGTTPTLSMAQANGATDGFLDSADWTTFNNKQAAITTGTTAQYLRGDLSLATLQDDVRATLLTGFSSGAGTVAATDTILQAFNKLDGNIAANTSSIAGLDTDDVSEGTALYFTDARAKASAVLNSTAGTETDQAASVAAMKTYVAANAGDIIDGGNTNAATVTIGTNDANSLAFETNNSTAMTILSGGNVGIGTASPSATFHINDSNNTDNTYMRLSSNGTIGIGESGYPYFGFRLIWDGVNNNWESEHPTVRGATMRFTNSRMRFSSAPANTDPATLTDHMVINTNSGLVGIGDSSPTSNLDIKGTLSKALTGTVDVASGTAAVTGTGTAFDTELNIGDAIKIGDETFTVSAIGSATSLTLNSNHTTGAVATTATSDNTILSLKNGDSTDLLNVDKSGVMNLNGTLALQESNGSDVINIRSPASITASYSLTLPDDDGASGEILTTDGSGVLSWTPAEAATSVSAGAGSAVTPSMSFSTDSNTGFYSSGADQIGIASNGTNTFNFTTTALASPTTGGASITTGNGTAAAPTFSFAGDTDTGWFRAAANELAASTGGTERVRIDELGNVGIGTGSPQQKLSLRSSLYADNTDIVSALLSTDTAGGCAGLTNMGNFLGLSLGGFSAPGTTGYYGAVRTSCGNGVDLVMKSGDSAGVVQERMRIDESGNVGIGTTSPNYKLDVNELWGITTTGHFEVQEGVSFSNYASGSFASIRTKGIDIGDSTGSVPYGTIESKAAYDLHFTIDGSDKMTLLDSGNVGIGTTSPTRKFVVDINNNNTAETDPSNIDGIRLRNSDSTSGSKVGLYFDSNGATGGATAGIYGEPDGTADSMDMHFWTEGGTRAERMTILADGNVGVGTRAPSSLLDVDGTVESKDRIINTTVYSVPTATDVTLNLVTTGTNLTSGYAYTIRLATSTTGTSTGAVYHVYESATGVWTAKVEAITGETSNHPLLKINGTTVEIYHNHGSTYPISVAQKAIFHQNTTRINDSYFGIAAAITSVNGYIGIGTTSPASKLEISGNSSADATLRLSNTDSTIAIGNSAGRIEFFNSDSTAGPGVQSYIQSRTTDAGLNYALDFGTGSIGGTVDTKMTVDASGNVGIGTEDPEGALDVTSTTGAFVPPRMTTTQRNALSSPPNGSVIYNSTTDKMNFREDGSWSELSGSGGGVTIIEPACGNTLGESNCTPPSCPGGWTDLGRVSEVVTAADASSSDQFKKRNRYCESNTKYTVIELSCQNQYSNSSCTPPTCPSGWTTISGTSKYVTAADSSSSDQFERVYRFCVK